MSLQPGGIGGAIMKTAIEPGAPAVAATDPAAWVDEHGDVLLNPTVIFEVLCPSTEKYDRGEKFRRYRTQIETLQDYVLVSQDQMRVEHHHRETDGTWNQTEISVADGILMLDSIECTVSLTEIYRNTEVAK